MPRSRLHFAPVAPALAALAVAAALLWLLVPSFLERGAADQLLDQTGTLAPLVAAHLGPGLQGWVRRLPAGSELRVTVIDAAGRVLADSARSAAEVTAMDNHGARREVARARQAGEGWAVRTSATTGRAYVYAARQASTPEGERFFLRLAQPLDHIYQLRLRLVAILLPALAAALAAMGLVWLWLDRRLFAPLVRVIDDAGHLADGRFHRRLALAEDPQLRSLARALNRLATRVEEQIGAAEAERDHLRTILARMAEGVLVVGQDGRALLANPAFRRLFSLSEEPAGRTPLEITRQPQLARLVDATLARGEDATAELMLDLPERRTLLLASTSLGHGGGAVVVARDTTAFTRLAAMRRDFVANVSHELKTPLAAIRGLAETLRDGALGDPPTARRFNDRILGQCQRLQALLDDLLVLSRLESLEAEERPFAPVALAPLLERAAEVVAESARGKGVTLTVDASEAPVVEGHAGSLERLALNLLDNAVKYSRAGGRVSARLRAEGAEVVLEVADAGIGISADALPRLFERFYRVDKGRGRAEGGTGLGLAIVKHTAQLHGGRVEVESVEGKGSTFRVHLPR